MKIKTTRLIRPLLENKDPILVYQGGTGSSKTYSILQFFIIKCMSGDWKNKTIDILRRTTPSLKRSVMKDFFDILMEQKLYKRENHNRTDSDYRLNGNLFRFYSSDEEEKMRGLRRDIAYFNEVLEFKRMDVKQVMMRTHETIYMDYNPSDEFSWIYDEILIRDDVNFKISTYKDNPFLNKKTIDEIKRLEGVDANLWRIYGLGQKGVAQATVFSNWDYADKPFEKYEGRPLYGMDLGYNDPTTLLRVRYHKVGIYAEQLLYKRELTSDLIVLELEKLVKQKKLDKSSRIDVDDSRPEIIRALRNAGFNVHSVKKGKDSVLQGIDFLKRHKVFLNKDSLELIKEYRNYKWKVDKDDKILDVPIDVNNHTLDALRYAVKIIDRRRGIKTIF